MKKHYTFKTLLLGMVSLCAVAFGSCYVFKNVTFSSHEIVQGGTVTVTATLSNSGPESSPRLYGLFAARVPSDWTVAEYPTFHYEPNPEIGTEYRDGYETTDCSGYALYMNKFYPKEGYKWIAFQTKTKEILWMNEGNGNAVGTGSKVIVSLSLKAGRQTGDFRLDFASGVYGCEMEQLVTEDGDVNFEWVFGHNFQGDPGDPRVWVWTGDDTGKKEPAYDTPNGLATATTMDDEEIYAQREAFTDCRILYEGESKTTYDGIELVHGETYPISPDFENFWMYRNENMTVTVKTDPNSGVDGVGADADGDADAEYYDMQGRRADGTGRGVFLVKRGAKVSKEIVR